MNTEARDRFAALHRKGSPLLLYNIWDAGSAAAVEKAGAPAIATGSHALAGALGFADGEQIPLDLLLATVRGIVGQVDCPVTADFEGGFAREPEALRSNAAALAEAGAIGCNFEDRVVDGDGLHALALQCERIAAIAASGLFVNARTDIFLLRWKAGENPDQQALVDEAVGRAEAYRDAGASSFFAPGLRDPALIATLCDAVELPVNIMMLPDMASPAELANAGVARLSWGGWPWRDAMDALEKAARELYA